MHDNTFIELHYPQYEANADGTRVADGARLFEGTVYSGVSILSSEVQAVSVRYIDPTSVVGRRTYCIELTLRGGATVVVPILCPHKASAERLKHAARAAENIREQIQNAKGN